MFVKYKFGIYMFGKYIKYIHMFVFDKYVSAKYANMQKDNILLKLWIWMIRGPLRLQIVVATCYVDYPLAQLQSCNATLKNS